MLTATIVKWVTATPENWMPTTLCSLITLENPTSTNASADVLDPNVWTVTEPLLMEIKWVDWRHFLVITVSQVCNEDGMEFTLRTNEPFVGRIYTYGFYDRCFFRGNGGTANVLRISGAQGYPDCGTQRVSRI
jgi:hypothetical protein